jgi:hypothetical protein
MMLPSWSPKMSEVWPPAMAVWILAPYWSLVTAEKSISTPGTAAWNAWINASIGSAHSG